MNVHFFYSFNLFLFSRVIQLVNQRNVNMVPLVILDSLQWWVVLSKPSMIFSLLKKVKHKTGYKEKFTVMKFLFFVLFSSKEQLFKTKILSSFFVCNPSVHLGMLCSSHILE